MLATRTNAPNPSRQPTRQPSQRPRLNFTRPNALSQILSNARQNPCHRQQARLIHPHFHHHDRPLALLKIAEMTGNERVFPKIAACWIPPASEWLL